MKINETCNDTHLVDIILSVKDIKKIKPNCIITGNEIIPRSGAFEITINKKLVY